MAHHMQLNGVAAPVATFNHLLCDIFCGGFVEKKTGSTTGLVSPTCFLEGYLSLHLHSSAGFGAGAALG
jgi:hypothetical protein